MPQFTIERLVEAPKEMVWRMVSDVVEYAEIAPNLSKAVIEEGNGLGMRRRCWDTRGGTWAEQCVLWQEGHQYAMEVDTSDYPYPLTKMRGTWAVEEQSQGTLIKMQFDYEWKYGRLGALLFYPLQRGFGPICEKLLDNWEEKIRQAQN